MNGKIILAFGLIESKSTRDCWAHVVMRTPAAASRPIHETEVQFYTIRPYKTNSFRLEVFSLVLDCEALDELSG